MRTAPIYTPPAPFDREAFDLIRDECGRRQMKWKDFIVHIRKCPNKHCREVLRNHMELLDQYRLGM